MCDEAVCRVDAVLDFIPVEPVPGEQVHHTELTYKTKHYLNNIDI